MKPTHGPRKRFRASTIWALVAGFLLYVGGVVALAVAESDTGLVVAALLAVAGALIFAFGSMEVARAKGYVGGWAAVGLLGLLGILGLIAILLLPDREHSVDLPRPLWSTATPNSDSLSLDRCPACGRLVPRGEPCPECEARSTQERSHAWDLRIIAAVVVGALAIGVNAAILVPLAMDVPHAVITQRVQAQDAAAKSLVRNAMTAMESAYVDYRTFALQPEALQGIEPSIAFLPAWDLITVNGDLVTNNRPQAGKGQVEYVGDDTGYCVVTVSETGTIYGVVVYKGPDGANWYLLSRDGVTVEGMW